jgi:leucyl-tRNA synthetase
LAFAPFPQADPSWLVQESVTCVVQVKGKVRDRIEVAADVDDDTLRAKALGTDRIRELLGGREPRTVIVRAPKLVNIVPA